MNNTKKIWNDILLFIVFHAIVFIGWAIALSSGASWGDIAFCAGIIILAFSAAYNHKLPHYITLYEVYICALIVIYQLCLPYTQLGTFLFWTGIIASVIFIIFALIVGKDNISADYGAYDESFGSEKSAAAAMVTDTQKSWHDRVYDEFQERLDMKTPFDHLSARVADWRERASHGNLQLSEEDRQELSRTCLGQSPSHISPEDVTKAEQTMDDIAHSHMLDEEKPLDVISPTSHREIGGMPDEARKIEISENGNYLINRD
ncbi:MAG TPA: hypothetical protein PKM84_02590 [Candidatus Pacearchaeota archaeon]|nr:hypothetical protein [Candidatus Pacearchaeota archaeon]